MGAIEDLRSRRGARWRARRIWQRRVVFWGGALVVGAISVVFTAAANWAQKMFLGASHHFWGMPLIVTPAGFVACAWATSGTVSGRSGQRHSAGDCGTAGGAAFGAAAVAVAARGGR